MKVSLNLLRFINKKYDTGSDPVPFGEDALVKLVGEKLGAVEEVIDTRGKYAGIKVVEIIEAKPHPDADKLNVYIINSGEGQVQVVSGDRNLNVGDKVAWLAPGTTVPSTWGTERAFRLESRPLRGEMSHGMFGSGKELDINGDESKVLVLDTDAPAGTPLAAAYPVEDFVIDIENKMFTHRPDCFGMLGVGREIMAIQEMPFSSPGWYELDPAMTKPAGNSIKLDIVNEIPELVPRFMAVVMDNVTVGPSPLWLQARLKNLGIEPHNNVVDITNFYMLETGQPIHAYDYDKVKNQDPGAKHARLVVRHPQKDETLTLLNDKNIKLDPSDMIVATSLKPVCLGGMMGGEDTEISESTKRVILEVANWDMYAIRRSSMNHGIFTDAVTRFSKGQSPLQIPAVLLKTMEDMDRLCGATQASEIVDSNHVDKEILSRGSIHASVVTSAEFINRRLGSNLSADEMAKLLRNSEFEVSVEGEELLIKAPFWRTDIEIAEDVVEEVGRLHGYDKLPQNMPLRFTKPVEVDPLETIKTGARNILVRAGANQLQTYSFVHSKLIQDASQDEKLAFTIRNALSPNLQRYRLSLTPSLLEKIHGNIKSGYDEFAIFEIGKAHLKFDLGDDGLPREYANLALAYAAKKARSGASFYQAKKYASYMLVNLGYESKVTSVEVKKLNPAFRQWVAPFNPHRVGIIEVAGKAIGIVGEYNLRVRKALKLPEYCSGFEINLDALVHLDASVRYQPMLKYPSTTQDICFKVKNNVTYEEVVSTIKSALPNDKRLRLNIAPVDIYSSEESYKQITVRIVFQHVEKTLATSEVNAWVDEVANVVASSLNGQKV